MKLKGIFVAAALLGTAATAQADPIILKLAHSNSPLSVVHTGVLQPWCESIEKQSNARLKCQIYPAMQLGGTPAQLVDQVKNGVADIAWTIPGYSPGRFPIIETLELPFVITGGNAGARTAWEFYQKYGQKDFEAYKVLAVHTNGGSAMHVAKKEVKDLAGMKGLRLRASHRLMSKTVAALGAMPVSMPVPQVTEAVSKGVVDGAMASWEAVIPTKLDEVTKFHLDTPPGQPLISGTAFVMLMNKAKYESLPADLKVIIDKNTGQSLSYTFGKAWEDENAANRKKVVDGGGKLNVLTPAEVEAMKKATAGIEEEWVKEVAAKGLDGKALIGAVRTMAAQYADKPARK